MKNTKLILLLIALSVMLAPTLNGQNKKGTKPVAPDCKRAICIPFEKKAIYGPTVAPSGSGEIEEIKSNKKNDFHFFEKEHNSAWYFFTIKSDGMLAITITPINPNDDYDFLLFKYTDSCFCDNLVKKKIIPVRTNISRTGMGGPEFTGLNNTGEKTFFSAGKGEPFSKSLQVKKGEKYYLVLDNVYPKGDGHTIEIGYEKQANISGVVLDEQNNPIKAEVILEDQRGNEMEKTMSDPVSGRYDFKNVWVMVNTNYNVVYLEDSFFVKISEIKADKLAKNNYKMEDIRVVLPKLRKGEKYPMDAINFYPGSPTPLSSAYSSMKSLLKLMKKNQKMVISIEGHVNNPRHDQTGCQELSEARAKVIYNYLVENKINKERMSTVGHGDQFMLFPKAKSEQEQIQNRRVEIKIVSY